MKERKPLVTIGIPTYNRADSYLPETLSSALSQTYQNIELVVADNCSTDGTRDLVASKNDPRIRYFQHDSNIGLFRNFRFCLDQAGGRYFLMLCDDDLIDPDFVETCLSANRGDLDVGMIRTGTRYIDRNGKVIWEKPNKVAGNSMEDLVLAWFAWETTLYECSTLFDTEKLRAVGGYTDDLNLLMDVVAEMKLAARYKRIDIEDVKASFRGHEGEYTHIAAVSRWCTDAIKLLELICTLAGSQRERIRKEGTRFLVGLNYKRAMSGKTTFRRLMAALVVYWKFRFQSAPPWQALIAPSPFYQHAQRLKRRAVRLLAGS